MSNKSILAVNRILKQAASKDPEGVWENPKGLDYSELPKDTPIKDLFKRPPQAEIDKANKQKEDFLKILRHPARRTPEGREALANAFFDLKKKWVGDMRQRGVFTPSFSSNLKKRYLEDDDIGKTLSTGAATGIIGNALYNSARGKENTLAGSALSAAIGAGLAPGVMATADLYKDRSNVRKLKKEISKVLEGMYGRTAS